MWHYGFITRGALAGCMGASREALRPASPFCCVLVPPSQKRRGPTRDLYYWLGDSVCSIAAFSRWFHLRPC